ncbi:MAG: FAD-binding and (Fe-S)-binding domain-containing protein [Pirellula sp.]
MNLDRPCTDILTEAWQRYAFANDAGPYLLIPQAVMQPKSESEVQAILAASKIKRIPVCFRAGGTSLSGQSVTDGWLVDIGRHWRNIEPLEGGQRVRVQPGAIGGLVNAHLKNYGRKIGPDPSSINSAMIGGMLSNNSSGMCCGVVNNAYHTLESIRFILPDGSVWDTSHAGESERFRLEKPQLCQELTSIRQSILNNPNLLEKIRKKYQQKNTVGYSLNAFVDYQEPLEILSHLLIGAEGTLAFISQAVLRTLPDLPEKATTLAFFADAHSACDIIPELIDIQADAVEFMDRASLESIRNLEGAPAELPVRLTEHDKLMGLLFEFQAADKDSLAQKLENFQTKCQPRLRPLSPIAFTQNKKEQANLWKLRKGMYPAVAAMRARGEAAILEDINFPLPRLADAILELQQMFRKHQYANGIIFGHAKDGNLHFVISQPMASSQDTDKYARLIDDMVDLVVHRFDGALKSEHGTGRNMAPFVQTEWGTDAVELMQRLKKAVDPDCLLNPDVILTSKPKLHLENIKDLPVVEDVVDKCVECGACEPRCPSRDFTLSPRQRIVLRRARQRLLAQGRTELAKQLDSDYEFAGKQSCATDGLCAMDCPVAINTGELIKQLRRETATPSAKKVAATLAGSFGLAERAVGGSLTLGRTAASIMGAKAMTGLTRGLSSVFAGFPQWHQGLEGQNESIDKSLLSSLVECDLVYWPTCMSRMMHGTSAALVSVSHRAGVRLHIPKDAMGHCCGQAFSSKGFLESALTKQAELIDAMWVWSDRGHRPIVMDLGSCTAFISQGLADLDPVRKEQLHQITIIDSSVFAEMILPKLQIRRRKDAIAIHSVCSNQKFGWGDSMIKVANACSHKVLEPHQGKCCGMGGDRGFELPGLVKSATKDVGPQMDQEGCQEGYTNARSCALSLSTGSGKSWRSLFHLLKDCTD